MTRPYITVPDRDFLRAVAAGRVYRSLGGHVMQRGGMHGVQNKRAVKYYRRAVAAERIHAEPDPETRRYGLTELGREDLAARDLAGGRQP